MNKDETFISWTRGLTQKFSKGKNISINPERIVKFMHRPFTKMDSVTTKILWKCQVDIII